MVEGGSGVGAAAIGTAAPAAVAPAAGVEVGAPALGRAPDVVTGVGSSPGAGAETPVDGATGAGVGEPDSDADRLASVQDRLVQQGEVEAPAADDTASAAPATGEAPADGAAPVPGEAPADGAAPVPGETPAADDDGAPSEDVTHVEGETDEGTQTDQETVAEEEPAAAGERNGAKEGDTDDGDLELADPATIAEIGLSTGQTRLALELLAGRLNVHGAAARIIEAELDALTAPLIEGKSKREMARALIQPPAGLKRWDMIRRGISKGAVIPHVAQRYGVHQAKGEVRRVAGKLGAEADAVSRRALEVMKYGTPEERAFALDAQIESAKAALMTVSGEAEVQLQAQIEAMRAERGAITIDGKTIPNQMQTMALRFASMFEPEGRVPEEALTSPLSYMQTVYANAISSRSSAREFFSEFATQGMIEPEAAKELAKTFGMEWGGPKTQVLFGAMKGSVGFLLAFLTTLYFKMRGQGGRGRAAAGAH